GIFLSSENLGSPSGRSYQDELDLFPTPDPHYVKKYYFPVRELERQLAFDMKGDDVIVFLHIQKTGGTTFGRHLVQNVRLEVPCDCRPGQKKCTCYRPNRRETWLFSRFSTGWSCGLHADWTELTNCVPGVLDKREIVVGPLIPLLCLWKKGGGSCTYGMSVFHAAAKPLKGTKAEGIVSIPHTWPAFLYIVLIDPITLSFPYILVIHNSCTNCLLLELFFPALDTLELAFLIYFVGFP
uniref:Heparan-sulfate 6-O-sulfotransferase n=1 Tax=Laticauda laticaudata TaxID=8630 RepID=A0A8C5WR68_LATLA